MNKKWLLIITTFLVCYSCKRNANQQNEASTNDTTTQNNDTTRFFQVAQFIQAEIDEVNRTPYFIYKTDIINGKKDSTAINTAIFNQIASQFLQPDINDEKLKPKYTESIFEDQTTKSFTISYTSKDKALEIQNLEILLAEDGQTVKRIFIRKFYNYPDSSAIEQLSWKPGENFQINRAVQKPGDSEVSHQTTVVWN